MVHQFHYSYDDAPTGARRRAKRKQSGVLFPARALQKRIAPYTPQQASRNFSHYANKLLVHPESTQNRQLNKKCGVKDAEFFYPFLCGRFTAGSCHNSDEALPGSEL